MHNKKVKSPKASIPTFALTYKTDIKTLKARYPNVWDMTSRDFNKDPDARLDFMMARAKDYETMNSFKKAISYNRHLFVGRNVLILNCGIDFLLTLWVLKQGAAHAYGVDTSYAIEYLRTIIKANNLNNNNISLIQGRIEDVELPVKKVDIIISNWMGYSLLFDSKIEALIYARDKWLKKDTGMIFPDKAELYVTGIENSKNKHQHVDWWRDVNGFNMNALRKLALKEPSYQSVDESELLTDPVMVWMINLNTITIDELHFRTPFRFNTSRCGSLEGILTFFDVQFSKSHTPMRFSTSPWSNHTSWLQTVFYFNEPITVNVGTQFFCGINMHPVTKRNNETNGYIIRFEVFTGEKTNLSQVAKMIWRRKQNLLSIENSQPCKILKMNNDYCPKENGKEAKKKEPMQSKSPGIKHLKAKTSEKKRRAVTKTTASIFLN